MKGRIIKAKYVWLDESPNIGYFAVNCETFPGSVDDMIVFYLEDEAALKEAMTDRFKDDFRILEILEGRRPE